MKATLLATVALVLTAQTLLAQEREQLYTVPTIPGREVLDRLNLEVGWRIVLPMEGRRDSIVSVQHTGKQILAQTRGGIVALFDAETGRLVWKVRIGEPFSPAFAPAFNSTSVFAVNGSTMYALDRSNGANLWQLNLPAGLAAPPVADEEQVYLFSGTGIVYAYHPFTVEVPANEAPFTFPPAYGAPDLSTLKKQDTIIQVVRPLPQWNATTRLRLDLPAIQSADTVLVPDPNGVILALVKFPKDAFAPEAYRFPLETKLSASGGVFGNVAYFPGRDGYAYALDILRARILWRQLVGSSPLTRVPVVTDQDLFVVSDREGMSRLDRTTGDPLWRIPRGNRLVSTQSEADRFLSASPKFVYALNKTGRLVVLDRARGFLLSSFDMRDYVVPVVNPHTDRLYLAANDGLILCLHDKDYPQPQITRKISEREAEAGKTAEDRAKELRDRLAKIVSYEKSDPMPLTRFLEDIRRLHGIKSFVSEKSFRENLLPAPLDARVKTPKKDKVPLSDVIQDVLGQINCKYVQVGEQIWIIPLKAAPKP